MPLLFTQEAIMEGQCYKNVYVECKHCGACDNGAISIGKGPHAYKVDCSHCKRFHKWASKLDVEYISQDKIQKSIDGFQDAAILAARNGDMKNYYKNKAMYKKYREYLIEQENEQ